MNTGWAYIPSGEKWCYYDAQGRMVYGVQYIDGKWQYFDKNTGQVYSKQDKINRIVSKAYSALGGNINFPYILAANGASCIIQI